MLKNYNHDLIKQLSEDSSSLWRYDSYIKSARGCRKCQALWRKMKAMDREKVGLLRDEIQRHVRAGKFN